MDSRARPCRVSRGRVLTGAQSFTDAERELFEKYGKVPTQKTLLSNKLKVRGAGMDRRS